MTAVMGGEMETFYHRKEKIFSVAWAPSRTSSLFSESPPSSFTRTISWLFLMAHRAERSRPAGSRRCHGKMALRTSFILARRYCTAVFKQPIP